MNRAEKAALLDQIEQWNDADEFSQIVLRLSKPFPETERDYLLTVKLSRAYSNLRFWEIMESVEPMVKWMESSSNTPFSCWRQSAPKGRMTPTECPDGLFLPDGI